MQSEEAAKLEPLHRPAASLFLCLKKCPGTNSLATTSVFLK
jgi:hypothetical protein